MSSTQERAELLQKVCTEVQEVLNKYPQFQHLLVIETEDPTQPLGVGLSGDLCPVCTAEKLYTLYMNGVIKHGENQFAIETKDSSNDTSILESMEVDEDTKKH